MRGTADIHFTKFKEADLGIPSGASAVLPNFGSISGCSCCMHLISRSEMGGLGAETLSTETFLVSVLVSVPVRLNCLVSKKSKSRETSFKSFGLGLDFMRPQMKVSVLIS